MKKGQAALEFLTTYGWAFLVILIMIGALAYFGVLDAASFVPEACYVSYPFTCEDAIYVDSFAQNGNRPGVLAIMRAQAPGTLHLRVADFADNIKAQGNCGLATGQVRLYKEGDSKKINGDYVHTTAGVNMRFDNTSAVPELVKSTLTFKRGDEIALTFICSTEDELSIMDAEYEFHYTIAGKQFEKRTSIDILRKETDTTLVEDESAGTLTIGTFVFNYK